MDCAQAPLLVFSYSPLARGEPGQSPGYPARVRPPAEPCRSRSSSTAAPGAPLHRQIYDQWRDGILSGRFGPGERIPSTRELADLLRVSRSTVTTAYDQLTAEGYLQAERGSGSFVSRELPDRPLARKRTAAAVDEPPPVRLSRYGARVAAAPIPTDVASPPGGLDLSKWSPDVEAFPIRIWRRLVLRHVRSLSTPAWESADRGAGHEAAAPRDRRRTCGGRAPSAARPAR